jgi:hypothetical protein
MEDIPSHACLIFLLIYNLPVTLVLALSLSLKMVCPLCMFWLPRKLSVLMTTRLFCVQFEPED